MDSLILVLITITKAFFYIFNYLNSCERGDKLQQRFKGFTPKIVIAYVITLQVFVYAISF